MNNRLHYGKSKAWSRFHYGDITGAVTEDAAISTTSGWPSATDVNSPTLFVTQANAVGTYSTFSIDSNGNWTYTLDKLMPCQRKMSSTISLPWPLLMARLNISLLLLLGHLTLPQSLTIFSQALNGKAFTVDLIENEPVYEIEALKFLLNRSMIFSMQP